MLDKTGDYHIDFEPSSHWILRDERLGDRPDYGLGIDKFTVPLSTAFEALQGKPVHSVIIDTDSTDVERAVPPFLREFRELKRIRLPSQIAPSLRPEMLPSSTREFRFDGNNDEKYWRNKTVALGGDTPFTGIESLTGEEYAHRVENRFRFDAALLPDLTSIGFSFGRRRRFGETLRGLPHLTAVNAAVFDSIDQLANLLPTENIVSLTLAWNKMIEDLRGIEAFPNLRYLKVTSLTRLRTLDAIAPLKKLEHVGIYWSKRVNDVDALLSLPRLRSVSTFGNDPRNPIWETLEERLVEAGVEA